VCNVRESNQIMYLSEDICALQRLLPCLSDNQSCLFIRHNIYSEFERCFNYNDRWHWLKKVDQVVGCEIKTNVNKK